MGWLDNIDKAQAGMTKSKAVNSEEYLNEINPLPPTYPLLSLQDKRQVRATTGEPINPNVDLISGKYDMNAMDNYMIYGKYHHLSKEDLWNLAAIDMQERGWGMRSDGQPGHVLGRFGDAVSVDENFVLAYKEKMKTAKRLGIKDEAKKLQVYNGLGKIFPNTEQDYHGFKMKKVYGVPVPEEGISLKENPLYGKQIIDLRDNVLKQNETLQKYIDSTYNAPYPIYDPIYREQGIGDVPMFMEASSPFATPIEKRELLQETEELEKAEAKPLKKAQDGIKSIKKVPEQVQETTYIKPFHLKTLEPGSFTAKKNTLINLGFTEEKADELAREPSNTVETPTMTEDNRTKDSVRLQKERTEAINNPGTASVIDAALNKPLQWLANPSTILGDLGVRGHDTNEEMDMQERISRFANTDYSSADLAAPLVPQATINLGLALGFAPELTPTSVANEFLNPFAGTGDLAQSVYKGTKSFINNKRNTFQTALKNRGFFDVLNTGRLQDHLKFLDKRIDETADLMRVTDELYWNKWDKYNQTPTGQRLLNENNKLNSKHNDMLWRKSRYQDEVRGAQIEGNTLVENVSDPEKLTRATRTGEGEVIDFATGKRIKSYASVPGVERRVTSLDKSNPFGTKKDVQAVSDSTNPKVNDEYRATLRNNINYIEEKVPGAKVFGSSVGVADAKLPHITDDYDVLISRKNYDKNVKGKLDHLGQKGFAELHQLDTKFGKQGEIDFNIIEEGSDGMATGQRAEELFRVVDPVNYHKALKESVHTGKVEVPYSPDELISKMDPTTKTIVDAYESSKPKHMNKIDAYINFGNTAKVAEAQNVYVKSLIGERGNIGHQFPEDQLDDFTNNLLVLQQMDFIGNKYLVAADPKRMQLALNDFYINNTILSRSTSRTPKGEFAEEAFKRWDTSYMGGNAMGGGLNHVTLGNSQHYGAFYGHKQLGGLNLNTENPANYVYTIKKKTNADMGFKRDERKYVSDLFKEHGWNTKMHGEPDFVSPAEMMQKTHLVNNPEELLNKFSKKTGIVAGKSGTYGNSDYSSTFRDFDESLDAISYGISDKVVKPKSLRQRKNAIEFADRNTYERFTNKEDFYRATNLLDDGITKLEQRMALIEQEGRAIGQLLESKRHKFTGELKNKADRAKTMYNDVHDKFNATSKRLERAYDLRRSLQEEAIKYGVTIPVGIGALGVSYMLVTQPSRTKRWETRTKADKMMRDYELEKSKQKRELDRKNFDAKMKLEYEERQGVPVHKADKKEFGGVIEDDRGQWAHPGKITRINSNDITMKGVNYPVFGVSDTGDKKLMFPGQDYKFKGNSVTEFPLKAKNGGWLDKYQ